MPHLRYVSLEELEAEIERRRNPPPLPEKLSPIDWTPLEELAEAYVSRCASDDFDSAKDWPVPDFFVKTMQCVYGESFWEWREKVRR